MKEYWKLKEYIIIIPTQYCYRFSGDLIGRWVNLNGFYTSINTISHVIEENSHHNNVMATSTTKCFSIVRQCQNELFR